jgi:hypothetical protein
MHKTSCFDSRSDGIYKGASCLTGCLLVAACKTWDSGQVGDYSDDYYPERQSLVYIEGSMQCGIMALQEFYMESFFFEMGSEAPASASIDAHSHLLHYSSFQSFSSLQIINHTGCT